MTSEASLSDTGLDISETGGEGCESSVHSGGDDGMDDRNPSEPGELEGASGSSGNYDREFYGFMDDPADMDFPSFAEELGLNDAPVTITIDDQSEVHKLCNF